LNNPVIAGDDLEGYALAAKVDTTLKVHSPVPLHGAECGSISLDGHRGDDSGSSNVEDGHQEEVTVSVDRIPDASLLLARNPASSNNSITTQIIQRLSDLKIFFTT
jgi:hypothetical protein